MAKPNTSGLTPAVIESLRNTIDPNTGKPYTFAEIARIHGVTRQYVSWVRTNYRGVSRTPREVSHDFWPFDVPSRFHHSSPNKRLRDHLEWRITKGKGMAERELYLLGRFYKRLRDQSEVVEFDPNIPPTEGVHTGGWAYRPRVESDRDLIIRVNDYTKELSAVQRMVWRLPDDFPDVE